VFLDRSTATTRFPLRCEIEAPPLRRQPVPYESCNLAPLIRPLLKDGAGCTIVWDKLNKPWHTRSIFWITSRRQPLSAGNQRADHAQDGKIGLALCVGCMHLRLGSRITRRAVELAEKLMTSLTKRPNFTVRSSRKPAAHFRFPPKASTRIKAPAPRDRHHPLRQRDPFYHRGVIERNRTGFSAMFTFAMSLRTELLR
jgi:hypothetical protein